MTSALQDALLRGLAVVPWNGMIDYLLKSVDKIVAAKDNKKLKPTSKGEEMVDHLQEAVNVGLEMLDERSQRLICLDILGSINSGATATATSNTS